jgi:hypothetical protein
MSIQDSMYRTVSCNGPNCDKTVTFEQRQDNQGAVAATEANPWLKTIRIVQASGRNFVYCSDACELANIGLGAHNPEERKQIVLPQGANAMAQAAAAAKAAEDATEKLKSGQGGPIQVAAS